MNANFYVIKNIYIFNFPIKRIFFCIHKFDYELEFLCYGFYFNSLTVPLVSVIEVK